MSTYITTIVRTFKVPKAKVIVSSDRRTSRKEWWESRQRHTYMKEGMMEYIVQTDRHTHTQMHVIVQQYKNYKQNWKRHNTVIVDGQMRGERATSRKQTDEQTKWWYKTIKKATHTNAQTMTRTINHIEYTSYKNKRGSRLNRHDNGWVPPAVPFCTTVRPPLDAPLAVLPTEGG